ncbi:UNVERIFIED_CONTAM: hypothetical protein FKN15_037671 [Acipenser sinensis]
MAQRTLLRWIWTLSLRELSSPAAPLPSLSLLSLSRSLSLSVAQRVSFSVQDPADFADRVLKSAQPVLVDFHAQ